MTAYLKVADDDRIGDAVGIQVLCHRAQTRFGHSDVDGELGGDRMEPEVQLGTEESQFRLEDGNIPVPPSMFFISRHEIDATYS